MVLVGPQGQKRSVPCGFAMVLWFDNPRCQASKLEGKSPCFGECGALHRPRDGEAVISRSEHPSLWRGFLLGELCEPSVYNVTYGVVLRIRESLVIIDLMLPSGSERAKLRFRKGQTWVPKGPQFSTPRKGSRSAKPDVSFGKMWAVPDRPNF